MTTRRTFELATACLVGVVGWPVLVVVVGTWLSALTVSDPLWWVVGSVVCTALVAQIDLTRYLWRFLDPRS